MGDVTRILAGIEQGDAAASEQLLPLVYEELRKLAAQKLAHEKPGQTLQATALVHEAYLRLVDAETAKNWNSRGHFFAAAAEAMRRILVEQARRKHRVRHGGSRRRVELADMAEHRVPDAATILAVDEALSVLTDQDPDAAQIVKLHFFAGLTLDETAEATGLSRATVYRQWAYARAIASLSAKRRFRRRRLNSKLLLRRHQWVLSHW
jgi:RNA polymerase sigma factor (TIGR02999 family)